MDYRSMPAEKKEIIRLFFSRLHRREAGGSMTGRLHGPYAGLLSRQFLTGKNRSSIYFFQKFREIRNAVLLNLLYDDDELLESLLANREIYGNIYGIGAASYEIYGREPGRLGQKELLDLLEFSYCRYRGCRVSLAGNEYDRIKSRLSKTLKYNNNTPEYGGNFRDYCLKILGSGGLLESGSSMKVYTTLDPAMQKRLEKDAVEYIINRRDQTENRLNILKRLDPIDAAALVIDVKTGGIRALIGSTGYSRGNVLNRAVQSRRQISSAFKPFLYALALEGGTLKPDSEFMDRPVTLKNRDGTIWEPRNFYPYYMGKVTMTEGLVISINTVAVQLIQITGVDRMAARAREVFHIPGNEIGRRIDSEPSLSLGSIDLTPLELAKGYLILAGGGLEIFPFPIVRVEDERGRILPFPGGGLDDKNRSKKRIYSAHAVEKVNKMLHEVIVHGTARSFIKEPFRSVVAGKSGSSPSDSWFAGFNRDLLIVTWAGYDNPRSSARGRLPEFIIIPFWYNLMRAFQQ